ncbi:hypothetical protein BOTCAL_0916g00010 [Botryotinia calthae]|uniref:Uncharacterized protein n=1 Tax=Botryotinia calthae TaxID=38488 RepID=A0A4Y8CEY7_9HELO|nr:hypothetical protein BOTCAL_0916g00010 [Botryotinia calthae]
MDGTIIENDDDDADTFTVLAGQLSLNPFAACTSNDQQSPKQSENSRENDHLGGEAGLYDWPCSSSSGSLQTAPPTILKPGGNGGVSLGVILTMDNATQQMGVSDFGVEAVQDLEATVLQSDSLLKYSKEDNCLEAINTELTDIPIDILRAKYKSDPDVSLADHPSQSHTFARHSPQRRKELVWDLISEYTIKKIESLEQLFKQKTIE